MKSQETNQVKALYAQINRLSKAETVTKAVLGELSRSILELHLNEGESQHDVRVVNRLLSVLSPSNKKVAAQFFGYFLPYSFDRETCTFGKLFIKESKVLRCHLSIGSFLSESPNNNIWSWAEDHITIDKKTPNYFGQVKAAVAKAIKAEQDKAGILSAVLEGGLSPQDIVSVLEAMTKEPAPAIEAKAA